MRIFEINPDANDFEQIREAKEVGYFSYDKFNEANALWLEIEKKYGIEILIIDDLIFNKYKTKEVFNIIRKINSKNKIILYLNKLFENAVLADKGIMIAAD